MKSSRKSILERLDDTIRWTGFPARVADQMSDAPSADRKHRRLRWIPIWPIAFSCALFILSLTWSSALDLLAPLPGSGLRTRISSHSIFALTIVPSLASTILAIVSGIYMIGPLGKPSLEDDERQAALRKDSFSFCLGLLAWLNCLGQPILMILSHWQNWHFAHSMSVAISALMLNATLFGTLPTLYASWNLRPLPQE